ncbi:gamma-glutamyl hydrolase 2-like [Eucalyptus grandis]|uniref:gamma-glutamyl hydrolase 2-like n=1 Tax=Eucalyptus grandis TaxID=71139 RepID=UPI00192EC4B6|nr:gamma-glutamyl hydrolase 2-like [Eucalyptus grandis]
MWKLNMVNGVLFTGGWAKTRLYYDTVKAIFKKVLVKNDAGDHFPLYAICLGFELLTVIITEDKSILKEFDAADQASTLKFMRNTNIEGTVFQSMASRQRLMQNTDLTNFFKVLTTSMDGDNKKNAFEWCLSMTPHSDDAIQVTQHVANFFVSEARKSVNQAFAWKVLDNLIYNYSPMYCGKAGNGYDVVYIFT